MTDTQQVTKTCNTSTAVRRFIQGHGKSALVATHEHRTGRSPVVNRKAKP